MHPMENKAMQKILILIDTVDIDITTRQIMQEINQQMKYLSLRINIF